MHRIYRIGLFFAFGFLMFVAGIWFSFSNFSYLSNSIVNDKENLPISEEPISEQRVDETVVSVGTSDGEVDCNTTYIVMEYDSITGEKKTFTEEIPDRIIGFTRQEVEQFLQEYAKAPSLSDREKGFVSILLEQFSTEEVVVKKIYSKEQFADFFFLKAEENYIVVYCSDMQTVYMYTEITLDSLPEKTRVEIEQVKRLDSLEELYGFLESYTS